MQKINLLVVLVFLSFICSSVQGQNGFIDDFSDGDFTTNPNWAGDVSNFQIDGTNRLQLNDASTSGSSNNSTLVTASAAIDQATWEFYVNLTFSPSTSNYAKVYLVSDNADLNANLNGYYVRIGGQTGTTDNLRLYRQDGATDTLLIDGPSGTVAVNPEIKVRVTKNALNEWELFLDQTATGNNYQSQGTFIDDKYKASSFFGIYCRYSSTRFDKFFFDDFIVTDIPFRDTIPPVLNEVKVLSDDSLRLTFNEKLAPLTALNITNYEVNNGIGNPNNVIYTSQDSTSVFLIFSTLFTNGASYEIVSRNIEDLPGNAMLTDSSNFTYFIPEKATYRDLVINELYPDFSPSNGLPEGEFVELLNTSSKVFDLANWTLSDGSSTSTLSAQILRPGEFIILCSQTKVAEFASFGLTQGQSTFPTLNNSGDNITLTDNNGLLIDFVNYTDEWYQDDVKSNGGYSLEQINPFSNCTGQKNFIAATEQNGGTPGGQNSTFDTLPDASAPSFFKAIILGEDSILLEFDEALDSTTTLSASYILTPNITINQIINQAPNYQSVIITLVTALDSGVIYNLSINGISDCSGNLLSNGDSIPLVLPRIARYRDIVINELYPDETPSNGLPNGEFIELFNASSKVFNLDGWSFGDDNSSSTLSSQILKPGEFVILCPRDVAAEFTAFGLTQGQTNFPSLNNSGDNFTLKDNRGALIDFAYYTDSWYQDENKSGGGYSLEQINPFSTCSGQSNFMASNQSIGGTPGSVNTSFNSIPETKKPELINVIVLSNDSLLLEFNESLDSLSAFGGKYLFNPSLTVASILNQAPSYQSIVLILSDSTKLDSGIIYNLSVNGVTDCFGNEIDEDNSMFIAIPDVASENDVVINEILFNPYSGGVDFVELFNRSEKVVGLEFLRVANAEDNSISNVKTITGLPLILLPKAYLVITENKNNITQTYASSVSSNILEITDLPSYNDDEGTVYLLNNEDVIIDQVSYSDDQHFDLLTDDEGVSLERINPERASSDLTNWHSASEKVGFATPGFKNSQDFSQINYSGEVNLDPEIISPNNDGFQDILNINYQFDAPGYIANVSIFDRNGRLIKKLISNELLDSQGTFSWDGTTDENTKARIGIYVVLFEAFTTSREKEIFKEVVTVASQLK